MRKDNPIKLAQVVGRKEREREREIKKKQEKKTYGGTRKKMHALNL